MLSLNDFFMDISKINLAHEFVIDRVQKCEYLQGRGYYGFVYVLEGSAEYRFTSGTRVTVTTGNMLFLTPNTAYTINTEKSFRHYTVNFEVDEARSRLDMLSNIPYYVGTGANELFERSIKKIVTLWEEKKSGYEMEAIGRLYILMSHFYADYTDNRDTYKKNRLLSAREYIEQNFNKAIKLEYLASLCNMSVTNFRREWKKRYSESPLKFRDSIRLHYANEFLSSGYYTVNEIAEKCGFEDSSYFTRFFKKKTGITPGKAKKLYSGE